VAVITTAFDKAARVRAQILGMAAMPIVPVPHPLATKSAAELKAVAEAIVESIAQGLTGAVP
jgi:hypothetical protein